MMINIALLYMGGTFGCFGEPLAPMPFQNLIPKLQEIIPSDLNVDYFAAPTIKDSSACYAADWLMLVQQIQRLQAKNYTHFLVIHGTDTLSYAAATLARFLGQSCNVILTGSQYPLLDRIGNHVRKVTDADDNLFYALTQLQNIPKGVYLAFNHQVFHGQTTLKIQTTDLNAFTGLSAEQHYSSQISAYPITEKEIIRCEDLSLFNIMMQPGNAHSLQRQLNSVLTHPPHFLIIQAFGIGNLDVNQTIIDLFEQLHNLGCIVILTTQVCFGRLSQGYAISDWLSSTNLLLNDTFCPADLYAKVLELYLKYDTSQQRFQHWSVT